MGNIATKFKIWKEEFAFLQRLSLSRRCAENVSMAQAKQQAVSFDVTSQNLRQQEATLVVEIMSVDFVL